MKKKEKDMSVVVLNSGGLDSAVLLAFLKECGYKSYSLFFDYDQRAYQNEVRCANYLHGEYSRNTLSSFKEVRISIPWIRDLSIMRTGSKCNEMSEYVPMRNSIFLAYTASLAESLDITNIAIATDGVGDNFEIPDAHEKYLDKMEKALIEGSSMYHNRKKKFNFITPFAGKYKDDTVELGFKLDVDFTATWTCIEDSIEPCRVCGSCLNRARAFDNIGRLDPLMLK
jgi:7-cyano-7-deazaguanine synthase